MTTNSETTAVLTAADIIEQEAEEDLGYVLELIPEDGFRTAESLLTALELLDGLEKNAPQNDVYQFCSPDHEPKKKEDEE